MEEKTLNLQKLNGILKSVIKISPDLINDKTSPETAENWDSFNGLMLVTELEKGFSVRFTIDEIIAVTCVGDIKDSLRHHGINI
ncbi:MAG TPA: acyl carrier protein [Candidatus Nanoarchaeia archaeon]|nr:acyl carrier protein [Candidatus Nanoarchaeia archaeon]